jgi:hypothetical protein
VETIAFVLVGLVLCVRFVAALRMAQPQDAGIISGVAGIVLLALVISKPVPALGHAGASTSLVIILLALYAISLAANDLWNFELGATGLMCIFIVVTLALLGAAFFAVPAVQARLLGVESLVVAVPLLFSFIQLGLGVAALREATAYLHLVAGLIVALLAVLTVYGGVGALAINWTA